MKSGHAEGASATAMCAQDSELQVLKLRRIVGRGHEVCGWYADSYRAVLMSTLPPNAYW